MIAKGVSAKHHHDGSDVDGQSPDARPVPAAGRQPQVRDLSRRRVIQTVIRTRNDEE